MQRDTQLDAYRAVLMIYVVCFIHVEYWLGLGKEPLMSLSLVEMPLIFFVSGAALSYHRKPRPLWTTVCNRAKRILVPYYIYALLMLCIVASRQELASYTLKDWLKVVVCHDIPRLPYIWHLWFVAPYMILSCTFDFQKKILAKIRGGVLVPMHCSVLNYLRNH